MRAPDEAAAEAARRRHYADFYDGVEDDDRPLGAIVGNCQAESLRVAMASCGIRLVRMPAVHELVADDMPALDRLLARAAVLVTQPIRDDYHGLPLGTRQLLAATAARSTAVVPIVRSTALHPAQAIVRPAGDPGAAPPLVPYHDLRVLAEAAGRIDGPPPPLGTAIVREIASASLAELRRREARDGSVAISDVLEVPTSGHMRTINHPGNPVFEELARRVQERLRLPSAPEPVGRELLDAIHAPLERAVVEAWDLPDAPREHWLVGGEVVDVDGVRAAHLDWYRSRPDVVHAGLERHGATMARLGL